MSAVSQSPYLAWASFAFGTVCTGFGIYAILRPAHALGLFALKPPKNPADQRVVDSLMVVYGVRDIFMGVAMWAATLNGHTTTVGWLLLATAGVAAADGFVCKSHGKGEWGHWSFIPVGVTTGAMLLGVLD